MKKLVLALLLLVVPSLGSAATYTVGPSGRNYTTIQACVNVAVGGDTCEVYAGTYAAVSSVRAGTSNSARITIQNHTGDRPVVASFYLTHGYITVSGFEVTNASGVGITVFLGAYVFVQNNYVHTRNGVCIMYGNSLSDFPNNGIVSGNTLAECGWNNVAYGEIGLQVFGDRHLVENNDISGSSDCMWATGNYHVIRNNVCHDYGNIYTSAAHPDGLQTGAAPYRYSLYEGNVVRDVVDTTANSHFIWFEGNSGGGAEHRNNIIRYNYTYSLNPMAGAQVGAVAGYDDTLTYVYNNTFSAGQTPYSGSCVTSGSSTTYIRAKNNICYNTSTGSTADAYSPIRLQGTGYVTDGNLPYRSGYSGSWYGQIASESTYTALRNQNPLFVNYPTDVNLQAASPARNAGVALTTVATADTGSGTTLVLTDAGYFQPGIGPVGYEVNADQIRIGVSTYATIASINYATNTVTLTASVLRNDGDPVYLYRKSDGDIVLAAINAVPDVGAYPYTTGAVAPSAPTNVRIR